jgi:hypothetical protein
LVYLTLYTNLFKFPLELLHNKNIR